MLPELAAELKGMEGLEFISLRFALSIVEKEYNGIVYYVIGSDYEDEIGISTATLEVYSISGVSKVFINSSLQQLKLSIIAFNSNIQLEDEGFNEKKRRKEAKLVTKELRKIDEKALKNHSCWWSYILEQTMDGLL